MSAEEEVDLAKYGLPTSFSSKPVINISLEDSRLIEEAVNQEFSKSFTFQNKAKCLPDHSQLYVSHKWRIKHLEDAKIELNSVKSKLNNFELSAWHDHTKENNYSGNVLGALKNFKPEFLTQAWCKFHDLVNRYHVISTNLSELNSVHLCELPGAFITSLNHFLKSNETLKNLKWNWTATTLNPHYEGNSVGNMINDDRFLLKTLKNWWFGPDYTGDIFCDSYVEKLKLIIKDVNLVTADGSIDCQDDPAEQENKVVKLHYAETYTALSILTKGGSFILKMFTVFECDTVCLLYLIYCSFETIQICKPVTSKGGNSEIYVVCLNFYGYTHLKSTLTGFEKFKNCSKALFKLEDIPNEFIEQVIDCSLFFKNQQILVIERNISTFLKEKSQKDKLILSTIKANVAKRYLVTNKVKTILESDYVARSNNILPQPLNLCGKDKCGTFEYLISFQNLDSRKILQLCKKKLKIFHYNWEWGDVKWLDMKPSDIEVKFSYGKPIEMIKSSKFCKDNLHTIYNQLIQLMKLNNCQYLTCTNFNPALFEKYGKVKYFDATNENWLTSFTNSQCEFMEKFYEFSKTVEINDTLILENFNLLSHFNVGFIYLLSQLFQKIGFQNPTSGNHLIIFVNLISNDFLNIVENIYNQLSTNIALLSIVPISILCDNEFYECVIILNLILLKRLCLQFTKSLSKIYV